MALNTNSQRSLVERDPNGRRLSVHKDTEICYSIPRRKVLPRLLLGLGHPTARLLSTIIDQVSAGIMRIAQVAPIIEAVPPSLYGGTERVVSWLTEELVSQGHEVTLFATGDSVTSAELVAAVPRGL